MTVAGEEGISESGESMNAGQTKSPCEKSISKLGESLPDYRESVNSPENRAAGINDMHLCHEFLKIHTESLSVESGGADIDKTKPATMVLLAVVTHLRRANDTNTVVEDGQRKDRHFSHD